MKEFAVEGRKTSHSRIAVLTGLTRKDVSRLASRSASDSDGSSERYGRSARVVTGWVRDRRYADSRGRPATLPFEAPQGASFSELVLRYSGDMPPRALLDELLRVGAVEELKNGRIRLVTRAYVPSEDREEKLAILGSDVAELIATIDHNIVSPPEEAFYQRKVAYDNLPADFLPRLREHTGQRAQALLEELDRQMAKQDRDTNPKAKGPGGKKAVIGIYYFEEDASKAEPEDE
jgi:hypothetical protein